MPDVCTCCELPIYSCSRQRHREGGIDPDSVPIGEPMPVPHATPKPRPVINSHDLTTNSKRAYTPIPRNATYPATCINPRCRRPGPDGQPQPGRPTGGRSNLCPACEDRIRDNLDAVADTWPDLEAALTSVRSSGDPVRSTPEPGIVVNEHVSEVMRDVEATLAFYGRRVRDERGMAYPLGEPATPQLARWLARTHLPWLAAHPDQGVAEALVDDAARLRRRCWSAAYASPTHHTTLPFRCTDTTPPPGEAADDDGDRGVPAVACGALVSVTWVEGEPMRDASCERGHVIPPSTWMRTQWALKHAQIDEGAARAMLAAALNRPRHTTESSPA